MSLDPGNAISIVIRRDEGVSEQYSFEVRTGKAELDATTGGIHLSIGAFADHGKTDNVELAMEEALRIMQKTTKDRNNRPNWSNELQRRIDFLDESIDSLDLEKNEKNSNHEKAKIYQEKARAALAIGDLEGCWSELYGADFCIMDGWKEVEGLKAQCERIRKRLSVGAS